MSASIGTTRTRMAAWVALCLSGACGVQDQSAENEAEIAETRELLRAVSDAGELSFGTWIPVEIAASQRAHAWTFELTGEASVQLWTEASNAGDVDTVLALYRERPRGSGRLIARNDDSAETVLSALSRRLSAGRYRVVVKGRARGAFTFASQCTGAGCPKSAPECLFGSTFYELMHGEQRNVEIVSEEQITNVAQLGSPDAGAQLVLAVQQSAHSDVTTPDEALSRVDQQTVRRLSLLDLASSRTYTAYEYGAGDNSYGAIFVGESLELAASIHDGDFLNCTAHVAACILPPTFPELRASEAFELAATHVLTVASLPQLSALERDQLLVTLRLNYSEEAAPTLEDAVGMADRAQVNQLLVRDRASTRRPSRGVISDGPRPSCRAAMRARSLRWPVRRPAESRSPRARIRPP